MAEVSGANNWFGDSSATVSISARKGILQEIHTHPKTPFFFPFLMKSTYKGYEQKNISEFQKNYSLM
jgi:queuine/archaeosine tRNA-ribosyltransferase